MLIALALLWSSFFADEPLSRLAAGDDAFVRMEYASAVDFYTAALDQHPDDPDVLWRLARVHVCRGEVLEGDERTAECKEAEMFARRCIEQDSTKPEGHCWLAAALGYLALDAGRKDQLRFSHELVHEVNATLALNPNDDAAYSILGSFYRALGNVSWFQRQLAAIFLGKVPEGGYEEAEVALKKAISLAPDVMRHQYELGVLYIDMGRRDEARKVLENAATLPIKVAIDRPRLRRIRELLQELSER
jgi:tetratricopeptide (TPR) repeat protein